MPVGCRGCGAAPWAAVCAAGRIGGFSVYAS